MKGVARCLHRLRQAVVACLSIGTSVCLTRVCIVVQGVEPPRPRPHVCILLPLAYSMRHISQLFRSNYFFLFQLPWLPEKLLSMSDFQVKRVEGLRVGGNGGWLVRTGIG